MREGRDGSSKFVFDRGDRMSVARCSIFAEGQVFDPADFVIRGDGVCQLNPEMARIVVARVGA
jgi:hypothetical protein